MRSTACFILFAGSLLTPWSFAHAEVTLQQQYLDIYLKMNAGDDLQRQGNYASALSNFQDCYDHLATIHQTTPDWESRLVVTRMQDCETQITNLKSKVASPAPVLPSSSVHADKPLAQQYLNIYLKMNAGDDLQRQGNYASALSNFQDCYDHLATIHQTTPDWESRLVVTRMEYSKAKIADLKSKVASPAP